MNNIIKTATTIFSLSVIALSLVSCSSSKDVVKEVDNDIIVTTEKINLDKENAIEISTDEDFKESSQGANELQTKDKYFNKTIKVTGEIKRIEQLDDDSIRVAIKSPNGFGAVYLKFNSTSKNSLMNVDIGDTITAYGYATEFYRECLLLKECKLVE